MFKIKSLSANEFKGVMTDLEPYEDGGHLYVQEGVLRLKVRMCSIETIITDSFYKPKNERICFVATFALEFFSYHVEFLGGNTESLQKFKRFFLKAKCPEKFDLLISRVESYASIQSSFAPSSPF